MMELCQPLNRKGDHAHPGNRSGCCCRLAGLLAGLGLLWLVACDTNLPSQKQPDAQFPAALPASDSATWWQPQPGLSWQWQLSDEGDPAILTDVIDLDLFTAPSVLDEYHRRGTRLICYISVGSYEDWRPDAHQFPPDVLGRPYQGWPGERWLDIRRLDVLAPIMEARLDQCAAKGFDAVEADNLDIDAEESGFPIRAADQLRYAEWLAEQAHARGLAIGQKNAPELTQDLMPFYDFAVIEDAFYDGWAQDLLPYTQAGKAVFAAEYTDRPGDFAASCRQASQYGFVLILKHRQLDSWVQFCPSDESP